MKSQRWSKLDLKRNSKKYQNGGDINASMNQAIGSIPGYGQAYTAANAVGTSIGNAVGGDAGGFISGSFNPFIGLNNLSNSNLSTGQKIIGMIPGIGGIINSRQQKKDQEKAEQQAKFAQTQAKLLSTPQSGGGVANPMVLQSALGGYVTSPDILAKSGIHINPANKGKFTATKERTGKSTEELTHSKNPLTRKRANFARMAKRGWKPLAYGGFTEGSEHDLDENQIKELISKGYKIKYV